MSADKSTFKKEFNFTLSTSIQYANKGEMVEASFISLKAPNSKLLNITSDLKQAFFRAFPKSSESQPSTEEKKKDDLELSGDMVMTMISMSESVELKSVLLLAKELFTQRGVALVDGEVQLTKPLIEEMDVDDFQDMVGEYLVNFILASSLEKMKKLLSEL